MENKNLNAGKYAKLLQVLFILILVTGLVLRFYQHFMGRSLWEDECHFALNFIKYDFMRLTEPLDDIQAGPIFFLWGVKSFVELFGYSEIAFRSLTWLLSILTFPLFYFLTLELTKKKVAALLAFLFFSVNVAILYFSSELKPYGIDLSAYLLMVFLSLSSNAFVAKHRRILLAVGGVLSILLSNTAFIVVFCSAAYMLYNWFRQRKILGKDIAVMLLWAVVFISNYFLFIHNHPSTIDQRINYSFAFMPGDFFSDEFVAFFDRRFDEIFFSMLLYIWKVSYVSYLLVGLLVVATVNMLYRRKFTFFLFTWAPVLITLTLSYLHIYPFWFRLILFLMPAIIILLSYGAYLIAEFLAAKVYVAAGAALILVCAVLFTKENFAKFPLWPLEIKPSLDWVNENIPDGMNLYMSSPINTYKYYLHREYVHHPIHKRAPWTLNPNEYYGMVWEDTSEYAFFYTSTYYEWPFSKAVDDFRERGLVVKEFSYGGYMVSIIKPLTRKAPFKHINLKAFDAEAQGQFPIWGGSVTSTPVNLEKGKYNIITISSGTPLQGVYPLNSMYVNDTKVGEFSSYKERSRSEPMPYEQVEDGEVTFRISLDNDGSDDKEDRNAFIQHVLIYKVDSTEEDSD